MGSHKSIYEALRKRSPEEAEKSMEHHLEQLMKDVNDYWHEFMESSHADQNV
jgi:DNA-binding GntR family transcriptional regulator